MSYEEAEDFRKLLQKLDRKATISWLPEMKAGRPVYDYLRRSLESEDLSRHQKANILHALFRLRSHGSDEEVFSTIARFSCDPEERVRSASVTLLIGMVKLHAFRAPFFSDEILQKVESALQLGLSHNVASLARGFLQGEAGF